MAEGVEVVVGSRKAVRGMLEASEGRNSLRRYCRGMLEQQSGRMLSSQSALGGVETEVCMGSGQAFS